MYVNNLCGQVILLFQLTLNARFNWWSKKRGMKLIMPQYIYK